MENERFFAVSRISARKGKKEIALATGFFLRNSRNQLFFGTNRHVVTDDQDKSYRPDRLVLNVHTSKADLSQNKEISLALYEGKTPAWLEHLKLGAAVDAVAIPIDPQLIKGLVIDAISVKEEPPRGTIFGIDQDAYVLGYPLGFADDVHNLPVLRRATVASKYGVQFEGEPRFLVDARLHGGSSGSPVFARASDFYEVDTGVIDTHHKPTSYFLGIFSDEWEVDDEPLGLNSVWYASIVREIVDQK